MSFAAIHIPDFIVQAVVRGEVALRERAVAIVEGTPPLWSVVAANRRAAQVGIELGMAKSQAAQFTGVEIRHRSPAQEKTTHEALLDLGWSVSPRVEDTAPDTIVLDLAGLSGLFGAEEKIAQELAKRGSGLGLSARIAVAENIEVAILASRGLPGVTLIPPGEEAKRLRALPVHTLLPALEILETLTRWGVETCGKLAALPVIQLSERLGQEGVRLHTLARGALVRSLVLAKPSDNFQEEMELDDSVEELESLSFRSGAFAGSIVRTAGGALVVCTQHSNGIRSGAFVRKRSATFRACRSAQTASTQIRKDFGAAGAHAGFETAAEIGAVALAVRSAACSGNKNSAIRRSGSGAHHAARIISACFAGAGKTGADHGAARESGGRRECGLAATDGYAPAGCDSHGTLQAGTGSGRRSQKKGTRSRWKRILLRREWQSLPRVFVFYVPAFRRVWNCLTVFRCGYFFRARAVKSWPRLGRGELPESGGRIPGIKRNGMWKFVFH